MCMCARPCACLYMCTQGSDHCQGMGVGSMSSLLLIQNSARSQSSIYKHSSLKGFHRDDFAKFLLTRLKPCTFFFLKCKGIGFSVFSFLFKVSGPGAPTKPQSGEQTFLLRVQGTLRGGGKQGSCGLWGSRTGPAEGLQRC